MIAPCRFGFFFSQNGFAHFRECLHDIFEFPGLFERREDLGVGERDQCREGHAVEQNTGMEKVSRGVLDVDVCEEDLREVCTSEEDGLWFMLCTQSLISLLLPVGWKGEVVKGKTE